MTQEQAAERMGIHVKHISRVETGSANVTVATLVAASLAYNVSMRDLFDE